MRVLHVINHLDLAGAEKLVANLALRMKALGVNAGVCALQIRDGCLASQLRDGGVFLHAGSSSPYSPRQIAVIRALLSHRRFDVVHSHLFPALAWVPPGVAGLSSKPVILTTEHSTTNRRRRPFLRPIDAFLYRPYAAVACVSEQTRVALLEWLPSLAPKSLVVENGIALADFRPDAPPSFSGLQGRQPLLLCIGRLVEQKGQDILIRALAQIPDARLVLVGEGPRRSDLESLAARLGLSGRITFTGVSNDLRPLLASADVYVQPSRREGFGLAAVEAMAAGRPVVASDVPGLREVVADAALKVPPCEPTTLASAILRVLAQPALQEELHLRSISRSEHYSIDRAVREYLSLYEGLLHGSPPATSH